MSKIHEQLIAILTQSFQPVHLEVINESHLHRVPVDAETHFKVIIASSFFCHQSAIQRHRAIYDALEDCMKRIHALSLQVFTPQEWEVMEAPIPKSPACQKINS